MTYKASLAQETMLADLRKCHEDADVSYVTVEEHFGWSYAKLSRIYRGERPISLEDLNKIMGFFKLPQRQRERLRDLREQSRAKHCWWDDHPWIPRGFEKYIECEDSAVEIETVLASAFPGLIQTPEYMREVLAENTDSSVAASLEDWIFARLQRQRIFKKAKKPKFTAFLDGSVLYRGTDPVLRGQLLHVLELLELPYMDLRLMPRNSLLVSHSLDLFKLRGSPLAAATELPFVGAFLLEDPSQVARASRVVERYRNSALSAEETSQMIKKRLGELA